ncbi:FAD-binding oxidoreductase [Trichothermofontia sp.]
MVLNAATPMPEEIVPQMADRLTSIVGPEQVVTWDSTVEADRQRVMAALNPRTVVGGWVYPRSQAELASVIACAQEARWSVLVSGSGSKLGWGGLLKPASDSPLLIVGMRHLNQVVEHAVGDLTVTVEAGMRLADLQAILARANQFLPIDPAYPEQATIGGIVATADTGALRQRYGGIRDLLLGITFVRSDGQVAKAGGRVVKNVAGYDLMKLMTGSWGTLAAISQVTLRVYPRPETGQTVVLTGPAMAIAQATRTLLNSALAPIAAEILSPTLVAAMNGNAGYGLLVRFGGLEASVQEQANRFLAVGHQLQLQGEIADAQVEASLWQRLQRRFWQPGSGQILCKFGVPAAAAIAICEHLTRYLPSQAELIVHAGSGLGLVRCSDAQGFTSSVVLKARSICQQQQGFFSVLEAPMFLKQNVDVWGYVGNALQLMQRLKKQFDPHNCLSPHRFVGNI